MRGVAPAALQGDLMAKKLLDRIMDTVQWAVDQRWAKHLERLRGYVDHLDYLSALGRQERSRRKPKLRLIRHRNDNGGTR